MPHFKKIIFPLFLITTIAVMYVYVMVEIASNYAEKFVTSIGSSETNTVQVPTEETLIENEFNPSLYGPEGWRNKWKNTSFATCVGTDSTLPQLKVVELSLGTPNPTVLSFEYVSCSGVEIDFSIEGNSIVRGSRTDVFESGEPDIIAQYWVLKPDQTIEDFLTEKISLLETPEAQSFCRVEKKRTNDLAAFQELHLLNEDVYALDYDYDILQSTYEGREDELMGMCGPHAINFYRKIDNVVFHFLIGHDTSTFSPASFRLSQ